MKQRILNIMAVLFLMATTITATAQSISIADFEARPGRIKSVEINVNGVSDMTALQFNLSLPAGFSIDIFDYVGATGDVMSLQQLESDDYLVVIYNMYLKTFNDDLSLPIALTASETAGTFSGSIYNIRMSTPDAVSHSCESTSFKAIVNQPVSGISLDKETISITEGETETLTATITPSYATDKTVTWTTSDTSVATVDGGVVTAVKAGTATITATAGGYSASCVVTVEAKPEPEEPTTPTVSPIISLAELSNSGVYYIYQANHSKGATSWAVATNGNALKSNKDLNIATDMYDRRQQFAILSIDGGATRYLYHVATKKFVNKDGSLSTTPADAISFMNGAYDNTFFAYFDGSHYVNVGGSQQMIIDGWNTPDGGNSCSIIPVGEFDSTNALKAINDFATGIDEVYDEVKGENGEVKTIYDLQGRKVNTSSKGLYIINGKKVLVK